MRFVLACVPLAVGCADISGTGAHCTTHAVFGIGVRVVDARTNRAPATTPVVTLRDGDYVETARGYRQAAGDAYVFSGAIERPGRYTLAISAAGYRDWTRTGVRVEEEGRCGHVRTVNLDARLTASP